MKTASFFIVSAVAMLFASCSPKIYTLQGTYNVTKYTETTSSYDEVWDKVIDFFATNNISISTIEKSSGIIAANDVVFGQSNLSMEDKMGVIQNPNAWFVMAYNKNNTKPLSVQCSLNVRVSETQNGKVSITINIGNITGKVINSSIAGLMVYSANFKSTGVFESTLLDMFK